ncbi:MAG: Flagellar biosynthesis protein FliO [Oscillospiraceae bacterium]|nr:Flagellar biosynthesis protein FliO [Oscillospiraceae bacterium]
MPEIISLIFSFIGVVLILILIVYGSKWIIKKHSFSVRSKHIKVIDRVVLGQDKSIIVAEICNEKYIIGVSGQQITLLKELGEVDFGDEDKDVPTDFATIFGELVKKQIALGKERFKKRGNKDET